MEPNPHAAVEVLSHFLLTVGLKLGI